MTVLRGRLLNGKPYALNPGTGGTAPPALNRTLTVQNWGSSSSAGFHKGGLCFARGEVPAGSVPTFAAGTVQLYGLRFYNDGSLKLARRLLRDTAFAAGESRNYAIGAASGSYPAGATAAIGNAGLVTSLSGRNVNISFGNVKQIDNSGNASTRGSGSFTASLATHAATATRWTLLTTGAVADVWQGWGMAADASGGAADAHLKVNWTLTRWKAADGSTAGLQVGAVLAQDWWSVANKYLLTYDAALLDGGTTVVSYTGLQHPYHSQGLLAVASGNNAGTAPWIGAAQPTLFSPLDQSAIVATGLCPPLNPANVPAAVAIPAYVPFGAMEHRANIDGTGLYIGRGPVSQPDADFFKRNDAPSLARARVDALAGLSVPYHYRSNRTRTRPGEGADTANTPIVLKMAPKAASYSDFTAQGLPVAVDAYRGFGAGHTSGEDGFVDPQGGTGVWGISIDASHAVPYAHLMAVVTGDEWLLEASIDLATNLAHQGIYGFHNNIQPLLTGTPQQQAANGSPDTGYYTGLLGQFQTDNVRSMGWAQLIQGYAYGLVPADHIAAPYLSALRAQNGDFIASSLANMPPDYALAGAYYPPSQTGKISALAPWQLSIIAASAFQAYLACEDARWKALGEQCLAWSARNAAAGRFYAMDQYIVIDRPACAAWSATNKLYPAEQAPYCSLQADLSGGTTFTQTAGVFWNTINTGPPPIANGDIMVATIEQQQNAQGVLAPSNMAEGQRFYVVGLQNGANLSGNVYAARPTPYPTFGLAATAGGAPINFGADTAGVNLAWLPASAAAYTVAQNPPYLPDPTNYIPIHAGAIMMGRQAGSVLATKAIRDATVQFTAPIGLGSYSPYDLLAA